MGVPVYGLLCFAVCCRLTFHVLLPASYPWREPALGHPDRLDLGVKYSFFFFFLLVDNGHVYFAGRELPVDPLMLQIIMASLLSS